MREFVIFQSDAAAAEIKRFGGFTNDLLADIVIVTNAIISDYESVGGKL